MILRTIKRQCLFSPDSQMRLKLPNEMAGQWAVVCETIEKPKEKEISSDKHFHAQRSVLRSMDSDFARFSVL